MLKGELKHIIGKLTYINNFVFANPHKKEFHAHCTPLQIAQADTRTKICKRVQFTQTYLATFLYFYRLNYEKVK